MGILDDDFDIDMAKDKDEKEAAERAKASKLWRTLRLASRSKLLEFEKIDDGKKISLLFETPAVESKESTTEDSQKKSDNPRETKDEQESTAVDTPTQQADGATAT